jgi:hypothetical protein
LQGNLSQRCCQRRNGRCGRGVILGPSRFYPAAWAKKARRTTRLPTVELKKPRPGSSSTQGRLARRLLGLRVTVIENKSSPGHKRRIHPGATKVQGTYHGTFESSRSDVASPQPPETTGVLPHAHPLSAAARVSSFCRHFASRTSPCATFDRGGLAPTSFFVRAV